MAVSSDHSVDFAAGMLVAPTSASDWLVIAPVILTLLGGGVTLMLRQHSKYHGSIACGVLSLLVLVDISLLVKVMTYGPVTMTMGRWLPPFGISFTVDAFGAAMATIAGIVALLACIYSLVDISQTERKFGFYPLFLVMMAGVSGSFLTGDIFNLYVWFEVLLISSFGLLILGGEKKQIDGALKYAILNLMATTLFLIATSLLYGAVGSLNMADITVKLRELPQGTAPLATIGTLFFLAFAMKAAAFPVNFWLPASYHTPQIVVSAVFAGLLTKVGVYALVRTLIMILPDSRLMLSDIIAWVAALTMIFGALGALAQNDVRRAFGYLVISGIGSALVGVAVGTEAALSGGIMYAVHSILVMTALYLAFGILMRMNGGLSNLAELGGGYKGSSLLSVLFLVLSFAVAGLPPFSGFWAKFALVEASLKENYGWLAFSILVSGFIITVTMGRIWAHAFWRGGPIGTEDGRDAAPLNNPSGYVRAKIFIPVSALAVLVAMIGFFPAPLFSVVQTGTQSLLNPERYVYSVFGASIEQIERRDAEKKAQEHSTEQGDHEESPDPAHKEGDL